MNLENGEFFEWWFTASFNLLLLFLLVLVAGFLACLFALDP